MCRALEKLPADGCSLSQWNDALSYLTDLPPQDTAEATRAALLEFLKD